MAQARLEKYGSIFNRCIGMMRAGALKWEDRPIWLEIYAAHPPHLEPKFNRRALIPETTPLRKLFYFEDEIRALFYRKFSISTELPQELIDTNEQVAGGSDSTSSYEHFFKDDQQKTDLLASLPDTIGIGQAIDLTNPSQITHVQRFLSMYEEVAGPGISSDQLRALYADSDLPPPDKDQLDRLALAARWLSREQIVKMIGRDYFTERSIINATPYAIKALLPKVKEGLFQKHRIVLFTRKERDQLLKTHLLEQKKLAQALPVEKLGLDF